MSLLRFCALAALAASASAFCTSPSSCVLSRTSSSAMSRPAGATAFRLARTPLVNGLRMQSEDDKAKASGIALAAVGLIVSKFSLLIAVLAGGAAVYAGKFIGIKSQPTKSRNAAVYQKEIMRTGIAAALLRICGRFLSALRWPLSVKSG